MAVPDVLHVVAVQPLALHAHALTAAPRVGEVLKLAFAGRLVLVRFAEVTPCLLQVVIIERLVSRLRLRLCRGRVWYSHCGEGRRHLGETVGGRCRGVARAVAPFTRWCHLGRIGVGGHPARIGCTLAHLVAADAVGGRLGGEQSGPSSSRSLADRLLPTAAARQLSRPKTSSRN